MVMTKEEAKEWFQIRDNVREAIEHMEMCGRCWRVRDMDNLMPVDGSYGTYVCRPGDPHGCLGR